MKYCSSCGQAVSYKVPSNDNRQRYVCDHCDTIHYQNPKVVVGCLPVYDNRILLCRRAIEPRKGYWTLPAGFMENGETSQEGAARETLEEACARVSGLELYTLFDLPHISQLYMFYRADLVAGRYAAGAETLEADLFRLDQLPWEQFAFPVVTRTLRHFAADHEQGCYPIRNEVIKRSMKRRRV